MVAAHLPGYGGGGTLAQTGRRCGAALTSDGARRERGDIGSVMPKRSARDGRSRSAMARGDFGPASMGAVWDPGGRRCPIGGPSD
jgi:hypothetical protein